MVKAEELRSRTRSRMPADSSTDGSAAYEGRYMGRHSLRILAQAGLSGVFFGAKILRGEIPRYRLPLPKFAANFVTCSYLLRDLGEKLK